MSKYDDREKYSNKGLLSLLCFAYDINEWQVYNNIEAELLARMSPEPPAQDDEWEELTEGILQDGDVIETNSYKLPVCDYVGKPVAELKENAPWFKVLRRVSKEKPEPETPQVKFAIAGTPEAELPGVVVLELIPSNFYPDRFCLHCKNTDAGYLFSINKYTGEVTMLTGVNKSIGLPLDDQGRLVIE